VRFAVKLANQTVTLPRKPVDLASGQYFFWPINFDMDGQRLTYATAQPVARLDQGAAGSLYVFVAQPDVPVEFVFWPGAKGCVSAPRAKVSEAGGEVAVEDVTPALAPAFTLNCAGQRPVSALVLSQTQARQLAIGELQGRRRLVLSESQAHFQDGRLVLRSAGQPHMRAAVYPALAQPVAASAGVREAGRDGLFQVLETAVPEQVFKVSAKPVRAAQAMPPIKIGGNARAALLPDPETFGVSAAWELKLDKRPAGSVDGALLDIDFVGDVARLFEGTRMVDDWYYNGQRWQLGLNNLSGKAGQPLMLTVLPLRADAPIYLPKEHWPDFGGQPQLAALRAVKVVPVYRVVIGR
jgi:hypothetical protein